MAMSAMSAGQAWAGKKAAVGILLKAGAALNAQAVDNMTSLVFAAQNGHAEVCEILLRKVKAAADTRAEWCARKPM